MLALIYDVSLLNKTYQLACIFDIPFFRQLPLICKFHIELGGLQSRGEAEALLSSFHWKNSISVLCSQPQFLEKRYNDTVVVDRHHCY